MTNLVIFTAAALAAVWATGRLDQAATALAVFLAWFGMQEQGWIGWGFELGQSWAYLALAIGLVGVMGTRFYDDLRFRGWKPPIDYIALVAWGVIQQAVLLGWLAQVHPVLAVVVFAAPHLPNPTLTAVTLVGGAGVVWISAQFGEPSILMAGLLHAGLSFFLRDWLGVDMGVGRSYLVSRPRIL